MTISPQPHSKWAGCPICTTPCTVPECSHNPYHLPDFYNLRCDQRVVLLFESPNAPPKNSARFSLPGNGNHITTEYVETCRADWAKWAERDPAWDALENALSAHKCIPPRPASPSGSLPGRLLESCYVTDVVKCSGLRRQTHKPTSHLDRTYAFLSQELALLEHMRLLVCFGLTSWDAIRAICQVSSLGCARVYAGMTAVHGYPFAARLKSTGRQFHVIPLAFILGQNQFLRNSYFDYLEEGLEVLAKRAS